MQPKPMLTVLFVKRFLLVFILSLLALLIFHPYQGIVWYVLISITLLVVIILQINFPKNQITVDEESICFRRDFPSWHPLRHYFLNELIIKHTDWDSWLQTIRSHGDNNHDHLYLFLKDEKLVYSVKILQNGDLEYWIQKKFPDRPLETKYLLKYRRFHEDIQKLKEQDSTKVF